MRVKAKTWGVIGKNTFLGSPSNRFLRNKNKTKSQLQTVLITASGPQAFNALVHRKRYTQGSRQNRCVSSQDALALRAKVCGTGAFNIPCDLATRFVVVIGATLSHSFVRPASLGFVLALRRGHTRPPTGTRQFLTVLSKNCQLRTAYGGESNCIIKT
jgi:hypothetical protein